MTSEEILGIRRAPDFQCVYINEVLKELEVFERDVRSMDEDGNVEEYKHTVLWQIRQIEEHLECLRDGCNSIRDWGQEWKDYCKTVLKEYEPHVLEDAE